MSFGDVLKNKVHLLSKASRSRHGHNAFWVILRQIAMEDICSIFPEPVDSDQAIPIYYEILKQNEHLLPKYFCQVLPSNKQERYRVITRNLFSSNAFHPDGLANQNGIDAEKQINEERKGERVVYQGRQKI